MTPREFKSQYQFCDTFDVYPGKNGAVYDEMQFEYIKLCFVFRLYWIGSLSAHAAGLLRYYQQVWPIIAPHIIGWRNAAKRRKPAKANKNTGSILSAWLQDPSSAPPMMCLLDLFNKEYDQQAADVRLDFAGLDFRGGGSVTLNVPAEWVEADPTGYANWYAELAGTFEFCSGLAGYGVDYTDLGEANTVALQRLYGLGRRHPGLDVGAKFSNHLGQGIKGVNWLTFLHPNFVDRLGGREWLGNALRQPTIRVRDLPSGVMIQAGDTPEIGDTNRQQTCPDYHQVGRVLAPIRDREYPLLMMDETGSWGSAERTHEWLGRFDGDR